MSRSTSARVSTPARRKSARRLSTLLSKSHKHGPRLVEQVVKILGEDGPVSTIPAVAIVSPTRTVIVRHGESEHTAELLAEGPSSGPGGTNKRVDHVLGYFRSRLILEDLRAVKSTVRAATRNGDTITEALSRAANKHPIIKRLQRASLISDLQAAMKPTADAKDVLLSLAAGLAYDEWSTDPGTRADYPMPKPSTIVKRKSLKGLYDKTFRDQLKP